MHLHMYIPGLNHFNMHSRGIQLVSNIMAEDIIIRLRG